MGAVVGGRGPTLRCRSVLPRALVPALWKPGLTYVCTEDAAEIPESPGRDSIDSVCNPLCLAVTIADSTNLDAIPCLRCSGITARFTIRALPLPPFRISTEPTRVAAARASTRKPDGPPATGMAVIRGIAVAAGAWAERCAADGTPGLGGGNDRRAGTTGAGGW